MRKKMFKTFTLFAVWAACNSIAVCQQPPGSEAAEKAVPAESQGGSTEKVRTLDEFRREIESKAGRGGAGMGMGLGAGMGAGMGMGSMGEGVMGMGGMGMAPTEKQRIAQVIQLLRERLTSKKHKRESVEKQLRNALQLYFDADMEERVAELDKVKAHLAEMEAKLQRRLESDREIIDLQLKQMLHKADGLEFSIPVSGGSVGGSSGAGYGVGMEGYGGDGGMGGMMGGYGEGGGELGGSGGMEGMAGMTMRPSGDMEDGASALGAFGYDCSHGFTAMRRVDANELEDEDPLKQYLQAEEKIITEGAELQSLDDAGKMEKLLLAMHMFTSRFGHFPRSESRQMTNQPPHSWRVAILPLIGYGELYQQYHFDEPWDSPANMLLVNQMPELYRSTRDPKEDSTRFQIVVGDGALDSGTAPARMADITDGTSNTIALVDAGQPVIWTKPQDVVVTNTELPKLSKERLVGLADGKVLKLPQIPINNFRAMLTRSGGEVVTLPEP